MSGDGFNVESAELKSAAKTTDPVADDLHECVGAADTEGVGGLVYGVLFDPTMLPLLHMGRENHEKAITSAGGLARAIAEGLRTNADNYDTVEKRAAQQLHKLRPEVEGTGDGSW